ncbi:MAG: TonB-dependent receptor [Chitinophagaceae bacterium]
MRLIACGNSPLPNHARFLKRLLKISLTALFLFSICLHAHANDFKQKITLSEKNVPLAKIFKEIRRQTGYTFIYTELMLLKAKNVSINLRNALIEQVLDSCFKDQPLTYAILNKMIIIKEKQIIIRTAEYTVPPKNIKGKITGQNGEALGGATIEEKGTTNSTVTKEDGTFSMDVSKPDATLIVTYVGYEKKEFKVNNLSAVNISLVQATNNLNDVVVVGYGTIKRKDLTGSVATVTNKDFQDLPVSRIDQALVGRVAGVQVKTTNGEPGAAPQIRVRGIGSISAGASPLYVVDGFPTNSIDNLNPNDIESLDILKDASATAIYGSRGSNGVIIINTKRGSSGKANISFNTYHGWQQLSKRPEFMNAREQAQYHFDGIRQNNLDLGNNVSGAPATWKVPVPPYTLDVLSGKITYDRFALDDVIRTAPQHDYQLSATGGNENIKYALSGDYLDQDGIVLGSDFKRYSLRANIDAKLSKKLTVKMNLNPSFISRNVITASGASSSANEGVIGSSFGVNPMYPLYNPDGTYFVFVPGLDVTSNALNPVALAKEISNKQKRISLLANVSLDYKIYEDLSLNIMAGTVLQTNKGSRFKPQIPAFFNEPAVGTDNASINYNWLTEYTLNYNKRFGNHNLSALGGFTTQKETNESNTLTSNRYPNNLVPTLSAASGIITDGSSDVYQWSLVSYLGRINYNYNSKYYVTASFRTDGSSRFGSERKFGLFPSAALAWRVSGENFLKNVRFLSELKLRASYGETGNNNIGNYEQFATINYDRTVLGGGVASGFSQAKLSNPLLTWEKQRQLNMGADASFFNNRLRFNVDYFRSTNTDLLLNVNVPDITGFSTSLKNIGEVRNNGWDIVLGTTNLDSKNFQWSTDINFSTFKNKVVKLGPTGDPIYGGSSHITMIGQPIGMFFGWVTDGIFLNQAELAKGPIYNPGGVDRSRVGDIRFKDISGPNGKPDGVINNFDKTITGSPYPDFYYGITNRVSYKKISVTVTLQGSKGAQIFAESRSASMATRGRFGQLAILNNYWKSEQEPGDGKTPRPNNAPTGNIRGTYSTWFLDNGTFLRINNITLAYVLPEQISQKLTFRSVRVYASANNPFLVTKNTGFNPEASNLEDPLRPGRELSDYPIPRSLIIGLNVSLK